MNYYSLNRKSPNVDFKTAVIKGIAPDRGLYFPERITPLDPDFFKNISDTSNVDIAFESIKQFVEGEIPDHKLYEIVEDTLCFNFPLVKLNDDIFSLELYHGPTMAFKDVGARFMARCLGYFNKEGNNVTVLVATSGDTGGAVASGFYKVPGVNVVILYPKGKVSELQEKQLTTFGENIQALEVNGSFDDCQEMVKSAFLDADFNKALNLTSANSINVARWLPQLFYYVFAFKQMGATQKISYSVPSGNFGNICAGMVAQKIGLPVQHFIAANNSNDVVTRYLSTQNYDPKQAIPTISNAMDVGAPSNFIRVQELHNNSFSQLENNLKSYSFSDEDTIDAIKELFTDFNYISDPHGAIGFLGCKNYLKEFKGGKTIFLETAHPLKFLEVIEDALKIKLELPNDVQTLIKKEKNAVEINDYEEFKAYMLRG